jgi:hypothetical protein
MRNTVILAILLAMTAVYTSDQIIVPKYITKSRPDGSIAVYDSRQIVVPKYIVTPNYDGSKSIYEAGNPVLPIYRIEKRGK